MQAEERRLGADHGGALARRAQREGGARGGRVREGSREGGEERSVDGRDDVLRPGGRGRAGDEGGQTLGSERALLLGRGQPEEKERSREEEVEH